MDESGTLPSDPSPTSDTPNRKAAPEPGTPLPISGATRVSASPDPALDLDDEAGGSAPPSTVPAEPPAAPAEVSAASAGTPGDAEATAGAAKRARAATERKRRAWEMHRRQSMKARVTIVEKLRGAGELAQGTLGAAGLRKAEALLNNVRSSLGGDLPGSPGQILVGPDRRACWDHWREVRGTLKRAYDQQQEQDHQALATAVAGLTEYARSGAPYETMRRVKELQGRLGQACLRRGPFEQLRQRLSEAWQVAQARITAQRQERSRLRDEWRARTEGHLARWRGTLEQRRGQREHLLQQVARLEAMEGSARSEDFAARARGWLQETVEGLRRTEASIAELEERIRTTAKQLGGRGTGAPAGGGGATAPPSAPSDEPGDEASPGPPRDDPPRPSETGS
jgi:hypothetical protein